MAAKSHDRVIATEPDEDGWGAVMPRSQGKFVHEQNVLHLQARLEAETDPHRRELLNELLSRERERLANLAGGADSEKVDPERSRAAPGRG